MSPEYISKDECPTGVEIDFQNACLLLQPYIKDPTRTIQDIINDLIAKTGENIRIGRFIRFELGK